LSSKRSLTKEGEIDIVVPRVRWQLRGAAHRQGADAFDDCDVTILSLYARGMTLREIQGQLAELYGSEVSPDLISRITDAVLDEIRRPIRVSAA
jgi:transposase-like protein